MNNNLQKLINMLQYQYTHPRNRHLSLLTAYRTLTGPALDYYCRTATSMSYAFQQDDLDILKRIQAKARSQRNLQTSYEGSINHIGLGQWDESAGGGGGGGFDFGMDAGYSYGMGDQYGMDAGFGMDAGYGEGAGAGGGGFGFGMNDQSGMDMGFGMDPGYGMDQGFGFDESGAMPNPGYSGSGQGALQWFGAITAGASNLISSISKLTNPPVQQPPPYQQPPGYFPITYPTPTAPGQYPAGTTGPMPTYAGQQGQRTSTGWIYYNNRWIPYYTYQQYIQQLYQQYGVTAPAPTTPGTQGQQTTTGWIYYNNRWIPIRTYQQYAQQYAAQQQQLAAQAQQMQAQTGVTAPGVTAPAPTTPGYQGQQTQTGWIYYNNQWIPKTTYQASQKLLPGQTYQGYQWTGQGWTAPTVAAAGAAPAEEGMGILLLAGLVGIGLAAA